MAVSSAVDVLALANYVSQRDLYAWHSVAVSDEPVAGMNGFRITPDFALDTAPYLSTIVVCCGLNGTKQSTPEICAWLRRQRARGVQIGAISTGSWVLADAGLLDQRRCTIHWEDLAAFRELRTDLQITSEIFEVDGPIFSCSGGTAAVDLFLSFLATRHGIDLAHKVAEQLICNMIRKPHASQRKSLSARLGITQDAVRRAIHLMERNIESPIPQATLAKRTGVSERQLERLFRRFAGRTPQMFYRELRLQHAQSLIRGTSMSVREVALASGFSTSSYFSKCYFEHFGRQPTAERYTRT